VKDEATFHTDMINQILILPSIFADLDRKLKSSTISNAIQLYKYFSKLHTSLDVSLPTLERANKEGDFSINSLTGNKYESYTKYVASKIDSQIVDEGDKRFEFDETLLSDSNHRNLVLNDLIEIDSFVGQRKIEITVKDYSSFVLFETGSNKEEAAFIREYDNDEFYSLAKSELQQIMDILESKKLMDLLALKQNPSKFISKLIE